MAMRPRQTEYDAVADAKHVLTTMRRHFAAIAAADGRRKEPLVSERRLAVFETSIAGFERAVGKRTATLTLQVGVGLAKGRLRAELFAALVEIRDEVKLGRPLDAAMGRAFGVGLRLDRRSTTRLLVAGQLVLSSWNDAAFGPVAVELGVTAERIASLRALVKGLVDAHTEHGARRAAGRGQTMDKKEALRKLRRETTYLRNVARLVFRQQPEVLVEFASVARRATVRPRGGRSRSSEARDARGVQGDLPGRGGLAREFLFQGRGWVPLRLSGDRGSAGDHDKGVVLVVPARLFEEIHGGGQLADSGAVAIAPIPPAS